VSKVGLWTQQLFVFIDGRLPSALPINPLSSCFFSPGIENAYPTHLKESSYFIVTKAAVSSKGIV
jgi:hypothetical protein